MTMGRTKSRKPAVPLKTKLKKDPGIPRLPDLKERIRVTEKRRTSLVTSTHGVDSDSTMASEPTISTLALMAANADRDAFSQDTSSFQMESKGKTKEQLRRHYIRTLHKVIDESDIIILVLDARDPEGCRSRLVEEEVRRREAEGKKLVFVLNKIDLVPRTNAQSWLKHLRHSTPTLPFLSSSSSQRQRVNISSSTAPSLLKLLKALKPKTGSVTVGVVGYPNVGKSSLINSLKRSKVCAVAAQPGHTKELQSVQLERGIRIVDSPGVVFDDDDEVDGKDQKKTSVLLRNVIRVDEIEDPIAVVEEILQRTASLMMQKIYNLPEFNSTLEFLTMLAMSTGKLLKGGTPDLNSAARVVLTDWNHQKIPYYTTPPELHPSLIPSTIAPNTGPATAPVIAPGAENVGQAQILTAYSKPFELAGLFGAADMGAFGEKNEDIAMADEDGDVFWDALEGDPMDEDEGRVPHVEQKRPRSPSLTAAPENFTLSADNSNPVPSRQPKRQRKSKEVPAYDAPPDGHILKQMERSNPLSRKTLKKEAKRARKAHRIRAEAKPMEVDDGLQFTFMA